MARKLDRDWIIREYKAGTSLEDIAKRLGHTRTDYIREIVSMAGLPVRHRKVSASKIMNLYRFGWTPERIADDLRITVIEVRQIIKEEKEKEKSCQC